MKGIVLDGQIEIKCNRCEVINKFGEIVFSENLCHYLLVLDERGIFTHVSDSTYKFLGYKPEELLGKHFTKINPTLPPDVDMRLMWAGINKNNFPLDTCHKTKDGKILPITIFFKKYRLTDINKESHLIASVIVKQTLQTVDQPMEKSINYFESLCDIYFGINTKGEITHIGNQSEKLCGYSLKEVGGKHFFDLLPLEQKKEAVETFMNFSKEEKAYLCKNQHIINNDRHHICDMHFTPRFSYTGQLSGYHILGWNIENF